VARSLTRFSLWLHFVLLAPAIFYEVQLMEIGPLGAMLLYLTAGQGRHVHGFLVFVGAQALVWAVVWWLLASLLSRSTTLSVAAAVLVLLFALAPIHGEGGHGPSGTGTALEKYRQAIRDIR
jgi:hypothetical protein